MLRPPRLLAPACAAGLVALAAAPCWALPAVAAETDGRVTVVVTRDVNGDGNYDSDDVPQSGIKVTISDVSGAQVERTTNDSGEAVLAPEDNELEGGRYFVVAEIPDGLDLEPVPASDTYSPFSTTVDVTSEDQQVRLGVTEPVPTAEPSPSEPEPATEDPPPPPPPAVDDPAPSTRTAVRFAVGDYVWQDANRQGTQDQGELPADEVSVQLLDADGAVVESTTSVRGRYSFDSLPAGTYSVSFSGIPTDSRLSPSGVGGSEQDSDPDFTGATPPFTLAVGAPGVRQATAADQVAAAYINPTIDAGIAPLRYAVGSQVWQDLDRDGLQEPSEPAAHARVTLVTESGREVATQATDDQGRFLFANLNKGTYRLKFGDLGAHRELTAAHVGSNAALDSDPDPRSRKTSAFELGSSSADLVPARDFGRVDADYVDTTMSAGVVPAYEISNRVWRDDNGDGLLSPGESGVAKVRVQLLDAAGHVVATTVTDSTGHYSFGSLPAGQYRLFFPKLPPGLHFTVQGVGGDPASNSDVYADRRTALITIGDDNPVETAISAGLTATSAQPTTDAPAAVSSSAPTENAALGATGGLPAAVPVAGAVLAFVGGVLVLVSRRRRR